MLIQPKYAIELGLDRKMLLKDFVGDIAVVATVLQFLSGILVCREYVRKKSTGEATPMPFLTGVLSGYLWLLYGIAKEDGKMILVNTIGVGLMVLYTIVFYICTARKSVLLKQCFVLIFIIGGVSWWDLMGNAEKSTIVNCLGIAASIVTLLTIASPMAKLLHVLRVKNTECLPFPIIFMSSIVSALWCLYGVLIRDHILVIVNLWGVLIAVAQLLLFVIYPRVTPLKKGISETNLI